MKELTKQKMNEIRNECKEGSTVLAPGYIKVSSYGKYEEYRGRYGEGYKVYHHNPLSSRWCKCTYWIRMGVKQ